MTPHVRWFIYT